MWGHSTEVGIDIRRLQGQQNSLVLKIGPSRSRALQIAPHLELYRLRLIDSSFRRDSHEGSKRLLLCHDWLVGAWP